jgi:hypothetical protein
LVILSFWVDRDLYFEFNWQSLLAQAESFILVWTKKVSDFLSKALLLQGTIPVRVMTETLVYHLSFVSLPTCISSLICFSALLCSGMLSSSSFKTTHFSSFSLLLPLSVSWLYYYQLAQKIQWLLLRIYQHATIELTAPHFDAYLRWIPKCWVFYLLC